MKKEDIKDIIKWIVLGGVTVGGTGHLKDWTTILFEPLISETRQIRFNQKTVIYNQHVLQHQKDGKTLEQAIEEANEHDHVEEDDDW